MKNALITFLFFALVGCGGAAQDTLAVVAPLAADLLRDVIYKKYKDDANEATAACYQLDITDEDGYEYVLCRARPVGGE